MRGGVSTDCAEVFPLIAVLLDLVLANRTRNTSSRRSRSSSGNGYRGASRHAHSHANSNHDMKSSRNSHRTMNVRMGSRPQW